MRLWKIVQLVGVLVLLAGVAYRTSTGDYVGTGVAMIGVLLFALGRIAAWLLSDKP
jgi:hypothetical protein